MISVDEALTRILSLVHPLDTTPVALRQACGRVLALDAVARRNQPPFAASAMDGYAVRAVDAVPGATLTVIGASVAGKGFGGHVQPHETVRIFTGAPVPDGADKVILQEDVTSSGAQIVLGDVSGAGTNIRPEGNDFAVGSCLTAGTRLTPADIGLLAAMNLPEVVVYRRPLVAILSTGDELVMPGETPSSDQIIASNGLALAALLEGDGAEVRLLPIARDTLATVETALDLAAGADLIVTIGGASVGDHDILGQAGAALGLELLFHKVALRPGKPLMAGRLRGTPLLGLPGNPVSSMVCGVIFLLPALRVLSGLPAAPALRQRATLTGAVGANGPREHYMGAVASDGRISPNSQQDSGMQSVLARSNALIVRAPLAAALPAGAEVEFVPLWQAG